MAAGTESDGGSKQGVDLESLGTALMTVVEVVEGLYLCSFQNHRTYFARGRGRARACVLSYWVLAGAGRSTAFAYGVGMVAGPLVLAARTRVLEWLRKRGGGEEVEAALNVAVDS